MTQIHLERAPVIYVVERVAPFDPWVRARLSARDIVCVASDLTRLECRVKPVRLGDASLLRDYDDYFRTSVAEIVVLTTPILDRATQIRAAFNFRTADAIHLAAAIESACDVFLTGDQRLAAFTGIAVEVVPP